MRAFKTVLLVVLLGVVLLLATGCGRRTGHLPAPQPPGSFQQLLQLVEAAPPADAVWPTGPPVDKLQPWEEVDADGYVIPQEKNHQHATSAINWDSDFTPGIERFSQAGEVTNLYEASRFRSGSPGDGELSYALYRISLASRQPGAVSADVNLRLKDGCLRGYWLGLSDYSEKKYRWNGPFVDSHIRLAMFPSDYTSALGSFFVCVVAYDGADFDLVGIGVNPRDDGDGQAPSWEPPDYAPTVSAQNGGVLVEWIPVIADDLAGYRIYYADFEFAAPDEYGVQSVNYLEGGTRHLIAPASGTLYVGLTAVDISGNESALSAIASADAGAGVAPVIELTTDVVSGNRGISANLTATGAATYDFDLDGDGAFDDLTGDTTGTASVNTEAPGIIRPAVRGVDAQGGIAFAAVSLIICVNSRPVAVAYANPSFGTVPLDVTFTGWGEDGDGTIDAYAWDFDGDGTYDAMAQNPPPHTYSTAGLYNAKFRATDNDGWWDVDTVCVLAVAP